MGAIGSVVVVVDGGVVVTPSQYHTLPDTNVCDGEQLGRVADEPVGQAPKLVNTCCAMEPNRP